ncbi:MAG: aminomethyl-transferring glycine dehydrogenase [Bacteroidetes bacterium]|nr:aminomethyl-transferring glycine dehydrogenase [Bacteroidota bacterium]
MKNNSFKNRHNGTTESSITEMLKVIGVKTIDELIDKTVPQDIRLSNKLELGVSLSEYEYNKHIRAVCEKNKLYKTYIGLGYYGTIMPAVIQRNIFENPGWYTAYTPYQAEISQGRLEALLNYQTMVMDLTAMPIANASLLDEATAAAEAMFMFYSNRSKEKQKAGCNKFFVSNLCFPQTIDVLKTRSTPLNIELVIGNADTIVFDETFFGAIIQYPDINGEIKDFSSFVEKAKTFNIQICVASDLMALSLITPPGQWGANCVVGNSQRFGIPMGFGGPHAAFFACAEEYKRSIPGRIIGVSVDAHGNTAFRMALQMREQHIKREKATSNICTAQALLAIMAGMYAVYHGENGIKEIASQIHNLTFTLASELKKNGFNVINKSFFDTISIEVDDSKTLQKIAEQNEINLRVSDHKTISVSLDETCDINDVLAILNIFLKSKNINKNSLELAVSDVLKNNGLQRTTDFLKHPVFNSYHSETEMMRYIKRLENKDLSLVHSMISLGSCTMKLNAASEMLPLTMPAFANLHPFVPQNQSEGYKEIIDELGNALCKITGFDAISFQPNSGAQGEYAGLMVIRAYHLSKNNTKRNVALIPSSAHGTNPASAAMAGMEIVIIKCDEYGNIDINDLRQKAEEHSQTLSCLMVTYPSTHGVYEEGIKEITSVIHQNGGLVYMDGANMNAQVGLTSPGNIGADVCHLNLHKTFAIPHGGGGPGMGPIAVTKQLAPFLPGHFSINSGINSVSASPYGSALILLISYSYIKMLGAEGLTEATKVAILNANYIKARLANHYSTLYAGKNGFCAHEMILDCHSFKKDAGVEVGDIAKRLMDYGFHAPTVAFPVHDTLMVEPTESESKEELDRFCEAMISIKNEIDEIASGKYPKDNNVLKNAPHTHKILISDNWQNSYSREKAAYPLNWLKNNKFFPSVSRIDNAFGDRNLVCACPPTESYN